MAGQSGFFDVDERLERLSDLGDQLETYARVVDFELFRADLEAALSYSDGTKGGRPPFDPVMMLKILVIQAQNDLSDEKAEFLINDRLSFMRFLGLSLGDRVPDRTTIWLFRERLVRAGAMPALFDRFDRAVRDAGFIPMSGQIIDASLVATPKQRNTEEEKQAIKDGKSAEEIWPDEPTKAAQKDTDARWTVKFSKAKPKSDGTSQLDIAIPSFGYKSHVGIDRACGLIRRWRVTDAARYDGAVLREGLLDKTNTASSVWADTAYRSQANEAHLERHGFTSHIHRRKPKGRAMPRHNARANARKSAIRAHVEHVFAQQKERMGLFVRTIGLARAEVKIGMANLTYNIQRMAWLDRRSAPT